MGEFEIRRPKVAILTIVSVNNFGAILQAYSLSEAFLERGCDCELLRYTDRGRLYSMGYVLKNTTWKSRISAVACMPFRFRKFRKGRRFQKKRMHFSQLLNTKERLAQANSEYDIFVSGSDQVWNCAIMGNSTLLFQDFVKQGYKKCSYAASFGKNGTVNEQMREKIKQPLSEFRVLSIREEEGVHFVRDLIGREAERTPDPVFLRTGAEWKKLARLPKEKKPYIFVSAIRGVSDSMKALCEEIRERTGWEIVVYQPFLHRSMRGKYVLGIGPEEFLGYLIAAEWVVTDSFHTTAFCILFHKNFWSFFGKKKLKKDARLEGLMKIFHLEQRLTYDGKLKDPLSSIDYSGTEGILSREREKGWKVIDQILEGIELAQTV